MRVTLINKIVSIRSYLSLAVMMLVWCAPNIADAYLQSSYYSQSYYQNYYQAYYQNYYQAYYESSYATDILVQTTASSTVDITGNLSKGAGTFVIDHPLDPENKLLYHSFVESPDVKNIYDGVVMLDGSGEAVVSLPDYFETLNRDYRYQVKAIDQPLPNLHIKAEVSDNQFTIGGGEAGVAVSWQVTGIRQDPYIKANPIIPEVEKGPDQLVDKGEFLFEGYERKELSWVSNLMTQIKGLFAAIANWFSKLW